MSLVTAADFGPKFLEAMGLDLKNVESFTLEVSVGQPVRLHVSHYVDGASVQQWYRVAEKYELVEGY